MYLHYCCSCKTLAPACRLHKELEGCNLQVGFNLCYHCKSFWLSLPNDKNLKSEFWEKNGLLAVCQRQCGPDLGSKLTSSSSKQKCSWIRLAPHIYSSLDLHWKLKSIKVLLASNRRLCLDKANSRQLHPNGRQLLVHPNSRQLYDAYIQIVGTYILQIAG